MSDRDEDCGGEGACHQPPGGCDGCEMEHTLPAPVLWLDTAELEAAAELLRNHAAWMDSNHEPDQADAARETAARMREICAAARKGELREVGPLLLRCVDVTVRAASEEPR